MLIFMISGMTTAPALPNGRGVQQYNPGVGVDDVFYIKGEFFHAIFDFGDLYVKTGSWVTISFGVADSPVLLDDLDAVLQGMKDFIDSFVWDVSFDGEDITQGLLDGGRYDSPIINDLGDGTYEVVVRYVFYINPQSVGCHDYESSLGDGFVNFYEVHSDICWVPKKML
jgi:hypothetical protein